MRLIRVLKEMRVEQLNKPWEIKLNILQAKKWNHMQSNWSNCERTKVAYIPHFKYYLENIPTSSLANLSGINASNKIFTSMADQSSDTNRTSMEHIPLSDRTIVRGWATSSLLMLTKGSLTRIYRYRVIGTSSSRVKKVVMKWVLILGGAWITEFLWNHWEPPGA